MQFRDGRNPLGRVADAPIACAEPWTRRCGLSGVENIPRKKRARGDSNTQPPDP